MALIFIGPIEFEFELLVIIDLEDDKEVNVVLELRPAEANASS